MVDMKSDTSELHRQLSSPAAMAAAAQAAAAGLFPPGKPSITREYFRLKIIIILILFLKV